MLNARTWTYDGCRSWDAEGWGAGFGWESESVVVQGSLPFSSTRSGVYEVESDGAPEFVGRDGAGYPAVEEVEPGLSGACDDLVDQVGAVFDSLRVVLDRGLVDGACGGSATCESLAGRVVE